MATIYSLICFGGKDGKTVTMTIANPCVVSLTNHGLRDGTGVVFTTSGALPTGVTSGTTYYSRSTASGTLNLYDTSAHAIAGGTTGRVTTTGSQSGTHTIKGEYRNNLTTDEKARYGSAGSERIYDGLAAWRADRFAASGTAYSDEICEIGQAFDDYIGSQLTLNLPSMTTKIWTKVNGVDTEAFHNGVVGAGYRVLANVGYTSTISISGYRHTLQGIQIYTSNTNTRCIDELGVFNLIRDCIIQGSGTSGHVGIYNGGLSNKMFNCLAVSLGTGFKFAGYANGASIFANNLAVKCGTGFEGSASECRGWYYNNMAVGNTTNYYASPSSSYAIMGYNGGISTDTPWYTGTDTGIKTLTADNSTFVSYSGNDFRPASGSATQVDVGIVIVGMDAEDMLADLKPNYNNGGAEAWDLGPFEYDHGYGLPPEVHTIDFSGLVSGSQVIIYTTATTTELLRNNSSGTTLSYDGGNGAVVDYTILKAGYIPIRAAGVSLSATSTPVSVAQQLDRAYATPYGLTFGTTIGTAGCNFVAPVTSRVVTSLRVAAATTVQNWYSALMDAFIASSTNTTLKNVAFPVIPFGEASFTVLNGIQFSDGATSIAFFKRDGLRYSSDAGTTITAIWAAILTLNTPAGQQVKYRQATAGAITNAANTGPMDQLVQVYGDASHGNYDYRGHMVLRAPKVGWSQPKPDLVATYGNLVDGLFVAALEPILQYACTDADLDAAHLVLNNGTLTYTISASHTLAEIYQRAQWWANQDAQWDATIPLTTTDGATFTTAYSITVNTGSVLSAGNIAMGAKTITTEFAGAKAYSYTGGTWGQATTVPSFSGGTLTLPTTLTASPGFSMSSAAIVCSGTATPTLWDLSTCTFSGAITLTNTSGAAITISMPSLVGYSVVNTGVGVAAITLNYPSVTRGLAFAGLVAGSQVKVFDTGTQTEAFSAESSGTSETWSEGTAGSRTVDYTVMKAGYLPMRVTGVVVTGALSGGVLSVPIAQIPDRTWVASSGLTYTTNCTINTGTKLVTWSVATTVQNLYSFLIEAWIAQSALKNTAFPFSSNGPNSITFGQGWECRGFSTAGTGISNTSLSLLSRDGLRYADTSGNRTASWCAILTSGVHAGSQVRYQQSDGGTTVNAVTTGDMDQLVQIYGDASHGSFDRTGYLVLKVQREGYDQAEANVYSLYGTLDDQLYVVGLAPTANGVATGNPSPATAPTISVGTYTYAGKTYGIKIVDGATPNTGTNILRWLRYAFAAGGTFQGRDAFCWHDLVRPNGTKFKTVLGEIYGSAATKGVVVLQADGTTAHTDFDQFAADDGSTYTMPLYQSVTVSGITTTSRVQIYDTTHSTQLYNGVPGATSVTWTDSVAAASSRAIRVRISDVVTVTAKEFIEANIGTCGTASTNKDISYLASQVNDSVYNANAINGPSIYATSGITFTDAATDLVVCNIGGGSVSWPTIYACFVYWNSTSSGIANDFTYIQASDTANYLLSGMKVRNTSAVDLSVIGGYGRDATTGASKDIIDTAGSTGNIFMAPDHVVPYAVSGTYAITGDISTVIAAIPDAATNAAATRSELASELAQTTDLWRRHGLDIAAPLTQTETSITAGSIDLAITGDPATSVTVTRQP